MELNGVANLHILVDKLHDELCEAGLSTREIKKTLGDMKEQLDILERYMIAYTDIRDEFTVLGPADYKLLEVSIPKWHEVRENRNQYPTNRERFNKAGGTK